MSDEYEIAFQFDDGEIFDIEHLRAGLAVFDETCPAIVGRRIGDDEWLYLGEPFRAAYDPHYGEDA